MIPPVDYAFYSPTGELHTGRNVRKFAREHDLDPSNMNKVNQGERRHYKGWTSAFDRITEETAA